MSTTEIVPTKGNTLPEVLGALTAKPTDTRREVQAVKTTVPSQVLVQVMNDLIESSEPLVVQGALDDTQVALLAQERDDLDKLIKHLGRRMDDIKAMVHNTLDEQVDPETAEDAFVDKSGHYVVAGELEAPGIGKRFTREIRNPAPELTAEALEDQVVDPDELDDLEGVSEMFLHEDYLACTTPVRVLDEHKAMLLLGKKPAVAEAFKAAMTAGKPSSSIYLRNIK